MMRRLLRAAVRGAKVTGGEGVSLRLDPLVMAAAAILPLEEVEIVNHATGSRQRTYVEPGNSGECITPQSRAGDVVSILAWGLMHDGQTLNHTARVVTVDDRNGVVAAEEVAAVPAAAALEGSDAR